MPKVQKHNHTREADIFFGELEHHLALHATVRHAASWILAKARAHSAVKRAQIDGAMIEHYYSEYISRHPEQAKELNGLYNAGYLTRTKPKEYVIEAIHVDHRPQPHLIRILKGDDEQQAERALDEIAQGWGFKNQEKKKMHSLFSHYRKARGKSLAAQDVETQPDTPAVDERPDDFRQVRTLAGMLEWLRQDCYRISTIECVRSAKWPSWSKKPAAISQGFIRERLNGTRAGAAVTDFFAGDLPKKRSPDREKLLIHLHSILDELDASTQEREHAAHLFDLQCPARRPSAAAAPAGAAHTDRLAKKPRPSAAERA